MAYKNIEDRREYQRNYMRERRRWLKENQCCTECKKMDAYTLNGHSRCYECSKHNRESKEVTSRSIEKENKKNLWKEEGKCLLCGGERADRIGNWTGEPVKLCEKHYQTACEGARKGREGRLRPLWGLFAPTEKAILNLEKLKANRLKMLQELKNSEKCTPTNDK